MEKFFQIKIYENGHYVIPKRYIQKLENKKGVGAIHGTDLLPQAADRFFLAIQHLLK